LFISGPWGVPYHEDVPAIFSSVIIPPIYSKGVIYLFLVSVVPPVPAILDIPACVEIMAVSFDESILYNYIYLRQPYRRHIYNLSL
jgi:hypothetical protein